MALKCRHCGSSQTQTGLHTYVCMECGKSSDFEGNAVADKDLPAGRHMSEPLVQDYQPEGSPHPPSRVDYRVNRPGKPADQAMNTTETSGLAK